MNPKSVLQKTDKGRDEIAKRTYRLEARKRTLLILVDGRLEAEAIAEKAAHIEAPMDLLQALFADGFVEVAGAGGGAAQAPSAPAKAVPPPAGAPAPGAPAPGAPLPLEALKRNAVIQIEKLMGPDGAMLALKIEGATSREEFFVEARKVHQALGSFLGSRQADAFARAVGL